MFDPKEHAGDNAGYELRIRYDVDTNRYFVTGYIIFKGSYNRVEYDRDGMSIFFDSMKDAMRHITEYE
jgi:hypothetical protein